MTDEEMQAMTRFGITHETKTIFHFREHRYDRLADAINYAKKADPVPEQLNKESSE